MEPEAAAQELLHLRAQLHEEQRTQARAVVCHMPASCVVLPLSTLITLQARLRVQLRKQATDLRKAQNVLFAYEVRPCGFGTQVQKKQEYDSTHKRVCYSGDAVS